MAEPMCVRTDVKGAMRHCEGYNEMLEEIILEHSEVAPDGAENHELARVMESRTLKRANASKHKTNNEPGERQHKHEQT